MGGAICEVCCCGGAAGCRVERIGGCVGAPPAPALPPPVRCDAAIAAYELPSLRAALIRCIRSLIFGFGCCPQDGRLLVLVLLLLLLELLLVVVVVVVRWVWRCA